MLVIMVIVVIIAIIIVIIVIIAIIVIIIIIVIIVVIIVIIIVTFVIIIVIIVITVIIIVVVVGASVLVSAWSSRIGSRTGWLTFYLADSFGLLFAVVVDGLKLSTGSFGNSCLSCFVSKLCSGSGLSSIRGIGG